MRETYKSMMDRVEPSPLLVERTRARMNRGVSGLRRTLPLALAAAVCVLLSVSALGAAVPSFNRLLAAVSPELARFLRPVELSCVEKGIRMEVVAAASTDDAVMVYLTLRDLEGGRLDETLWLGDFSLEGTGGRAALAEQVLTGYDGDTGTATVFLRFTGEEGVLAGDDAVIRARSLFSSRKEYADVPIPADWEARPKTVPLETLADAYTVYDAEDSAGMDAPRVLEPDTGGAPVRDGIGFARITAAGYADGLFHVQLQMDGGAEQEADVRLYNDGRQSDGYSVAFETGDKTRYREFLFPVPQKELKECFLLGDFAQWETQIQGDWQVAFPLQKMEGDSVTLRNLDIGGERIGELAVTPMGLLLTAERPQSFQIKLSCDGKPVRFDVESWDACEGRSAGARWLPQTPIDFTGDLALTINGMEIPLPSR